VRTITLTWENNVAKLGVAITGSGSATPSLDNHALSQVVETSDELLYGLEFVTDGWQQYRTP